MQKRFHQIIEGTTKVMVPKVKNIKGPTTSKVPIFYNPVMEFNRDVSILVLRNYILDFTKDTNFKTLDGLAGTGIRGVRLANEIGSIGEVTINDRNPLAFDLIRKNIKLNKLKDTTASNNDLNVFLINNRNKFNYIDIDPFGSPVEFIEQSCRAIRDRGLIAISATDTATLCGRYPKTCVRRYDAITIKPIFRHELGIRVLIGYSARQAAKYELALTPLLVHSTDHYYRVYFQARKGSRRADKCIENIGFIWYNPENGARGFSPVPVTEFAYAGPLWTGSLFDYEFTKSLNPDDKTFGTNRKLSKMLTLWRDEANAPALFYEITELASRFKISPPPMEKIFNALKDEDHMATRTHFSPQGFRTDADIETIKNIFQKIS